MTIKLAALSILSIATALAACGGSTGLAFVSFPVFASGTAPAPFQAGNWTVTLTVAQVGFGPAYFCPEAGGSNTECSVAVVEFRSVADVDTLAPAPLSVGTMNGVTGTVESANLDYAYSWLKTEVRAAVDPGAPGGHSAHFEGSATNGLRTIEFLSDIDVIPQSAGINAVTNQVVPKTPITTKTRRLDVHFDPAAWWRSADFDRIAALDTTGAPIVVPPADGSVNAVILRMENAPPTFTWTGS